MAARRAKSISYKAPADIAQWLEELSAKTGQDKGMILTTAVREYVKTHSAEEVEVHIREAAHTEEEWPAKGGSGAEANAPQG